MKADTDGKLRRIYPSVGKASVQGRRVGNQLVSVSWPCASMHLALVSYNCEDNRMRIFGLSLTTLAAFFFFYWLGTKFNVISRLPIIGG